MADTKEDPTGKTVEEEDLGELGELIGFLTAPQPHVRQQAVDIVNQVAGSDDGPQQLAKASKRLLPPVLRLLGGRSEEAKSAVAALVNLSTDVRHRDTMLELGVIGRAMESLREPGCSIREGLAMLLSNVTLSEKGARKMLQVGEEGTEGLLLNYLVAMVVNSEKASELQRREMRHLAGVLPNVARIPEGRDMLLAKGSGFIQQLIPQLKSTQVERRIAMANLLKNLSMDKSIGVEALLAEGGHELIPALLRPISGEAPRERVAEVRQAAAEAVQLMVCSQVGFDRLWAAGAPEILRKGYTDEEDPIVCEAMELTAEQFMTQSLFEGGEGAPGDGHDSDEEDRRLAELADLTIKTTI